MDDLDILVQSHLFSGIEPNDIEKMLICLSAMRKEYEKGEMVVCEGDSVNDIGIILKGSARSTKLSITGKQIIVSLHYPGGYTAILTAASGKRKCPSRYRHWSPLLCFLFLSEMC